MYSNTKMCFLSLKAHHYSFLLFKKNYCNASANCLQFSTATFISLALLHIVTELIIKAKESIVKLVTWSSIKQNIHTSNIYNLNRILLVLIFLQIIEIPPPVLSLALNFLKVSSLLQIQNLENIELFPKTAIFFFLLFVESLKTFLPPTFQKSHFHLK